MKNISDTVLLIVDDEPNIIAALRRLFVRIGYKVISATDGFKALEQLNTIEVDLVISDYLMPNMNGGELLRRIHAERPQIPLILLTGTTKILDNSAMQNNAYIYKVVGKPWDNNDLVLIVKNALLGTTK